MRNILLHVLATVKLFLKNLIMCLTCTETNSENINHGISKFQAPFPQCVLTITTHTNLVTWMLFRCWDTE